MSGRHRAGRPERRRAALITASIGLVIAGFTAWPAPSRSSSVKPLAETPAMQAAVVAAPEAVRLDKPTALLGPRHRTTAPMRPASRSATRAARWCVPAQGPVTSTFGPRWGSRHPGVDIGAPYGSSVRAVTGGTVTSAGWLGGYGLTVTVSTRSGVFYYPHMSKLFITAGRVAGCQRLGLVGSTGFSTGPHLHLELRLAGRAVDPRPLLRQHGVSLGS